jgi:hypothetical protein
VLLTFRWKQREEGLLKGAFVYYRLRIPLTDCQRIQNLRVIDVGDRPVALTFWNCFRSPSSFGCW